MLITIAEYAKRHKIRRTTLLNWAKTGKVKGEKKTVIVDRWFIDDQEVLTKKVR